ncbi:MAG: stage III sporulation protein AF [Lachnospiraceae bacterium]|nr:hypothetical protein [Lachnospira sp.]MBR6696962.1 stage III sporulation protein AF [Lachnospiraceae bacterium]
MKQYIMQLLGFVLLSATIINVIPSNNYKSYIKLFLGFVLIISILTPISKLLNFEDGLNGWYQKTIAAINTEVGEIDFEELERYSNALVLDEYNEKMRQKINEIMHSYNYNATKLELEYTNDYAIKAMKIYLSDTRIMVEKINIGGVSAPKVEKMEIIEIKERIALLYGIDKANIHIYGEEG